MQSLRQRLLIGGRKIHMRSAYLPASGPPSVNVSGVVALVSFDVKIDAVLL